MRFIEAENLSKHYGRGEAGVAAVKNVTFGIDSGEFVALMGESGSGKSTLLSMMGALNTPTAGRYMVDDIDVYALTPEQKADFRREFLGFVFQSFHLLPYLTVLENVMLPLATVKMKGRRKHDMAQDALTHVGLIDKSRRLPSQVSGGEQERVAIARAIVNDPPILLADEPTGNLDSRTSEEILNLLQSLNGNGTTVVMVTHSRESARYAGRIIRMSDGCLLEEETDTAASEPWIKVPGRGRGRGAWAPGPPRERPPFGRRVPERRAREPGAD